MMMTMEAKGKGFLSSCAIFARAFNLLLPFQLCMVGSSFAMRRFGYNNEAVPIFVAFCSNAMELYYTYTNLSAFVLTAVLKALPGTKDLFNHIVSGLSMVSVCFTVVVNVLLLRTYALDDGDNSITRYYWLLLLANMAAGMDDTFIHSLASDDLSPFQFGFSTTGLAVAGYHWIAIKIIDCIGANVDYWLIVTQLVLSVGISFIAAVLWIAYLVKDKVMEHGNSGDKEEEMGKNGSSPTWGFALGFAKSLPMIVVCMVTLSTLWAVYPYISPFETVDFDYHYPIQRLCLVFQAVVGVFMWVLDTYCKEMKTDWYSRKTFWWHLIWLAMVPYLAVGVLFLRCLHYPQSSITKTILARPNLVGFLTIFYYCASRLVYGISDVVADANSEKQGEIISPLNRTLSVLLLNVVKYMSEAYIQIFRMAKTGIQRGKPWPTANMSRNAAINYWIKSSATLGYTNFKEQSNVSVRDRLLSATKRIVHYERLSLD